MTLGPVRHIDEVWDAGQTGWGQGTHARPRLLNARPLGP
jgi:hypothetical protein